MPQVEEIVRSHLSDRSQQCIILEGSALWPELVANLVDRNGVKAIWLTASDRLFQNRIKRESNFYNVGENERYLIQKFLARTLLYNKRMKEKVELLGFTRIDIESVSVGDELSNKCMELIEVS